MNIIKKVFLASLLFLVSCGNDDDYLPVISGYINFNTTSSYTVTDTYRGGFLWLSVRERETIINKLGTWRVSLDEAQILLNENGDVTVLVPSPNLTYFDHDDIIYSEDEYETEVWNYYLENIFIENTLSKALYEIEERINLLFSNIYAANVSVVFN